MDFLFAALLAFLTSSSVEVTGDGVLRGEPAPVEATARALGSGRWLPSVNSAEYSLLIGADDKPRAVVLTRSIEGPLRQVYERTVVFAEGGLRFHHTEEVALGRRRLVWRELRPTGARTWVLAWDPSSAKVTGYGWRRPIHETPSGPWGAGVVGPLELTRRLRTGARVPGGHALVVDPAAASVATVQLRSEEQGLAARRGDGSLLFALGEGTVRFQDGPWVSRPIPRAEAERLRDRWLVPSRPAHEVVRAAFRRQR